jgi:hypothetical protein
MIWSISPSFSKNLQGLKPLMERKLNVAAEAATHKALAQPTKKTVVIPWRAACRETLLSPDNQATEGFLASLGMTTKYYFRCYCRCHSRAAPRKPQKNNSLIEDSSWIE